LLVGVVAVVAVASALGASAYTTKSSAVKSGGTLTLGWEQSFGWNDNFDPTGEYLGDAFGIYTNLLVRTLVGYRHMPGAAGNQLVPDIATAVPKAANGGTSYTFHIKPGIMFSPPVSRQVTSKDFVTAFERIANPKDGAQYFFYYTTIKGFAAYRDGKAKSISGISTPNSSTIVFKLTQPTNDFLQVLAMPAAGPLPAEVTKCFEGQPGKYSADLISTAGYMIAGIDKVNISSCSAMKPASGFDGQTHLDLVRNPNYKQSTDPYRKNYVDQVKFLVDSSSVDIYNKIEAGQFNFAAVSSIPPQVIEKYATSSSLRKYMHVNDGDRTWYITMNTTQPPFDDVHVRRAMNWIIDKQAMRQAWGGPLTGTIANHIVPDTLFDFKLQEYKPYGTPGDHGSVAKAKQALKGSKYADSSGMCVAKECKNILLIADARSVDPGMVQVIQQDAKKVGITFTVRTINGAYPTIQTVAKNIPISERPGWGKDFANAVTFFEPLFDGRNLIPTGNTNYSLLGVTSAQCKKFKVTGTCTPYNAKTGIGVPSINPLIDKCGKLLGNSGTTCWENTDKYLMQTAVPWVPWLWAKVIRITSSNVTHYQFDQFSTTPAYSQISVK
jgi:peptide/nickel transport system substrate-binding protein